MSPASIEMNDTINEFESRTRPAPAPASLTGAYLAERVVSLGWQLEDARQEVARLQAELAAERKVCMLWPRATEIVMGDGELFIVDEHDHDLWSTKKIGLDHLTLVLGVDLASELLDAPRDCDGNQRVSLRREATR